MSVRVPKDSLRENLVLAADEIIRLRENEALALAAMIEARDYLAAHLESPMARLERWVRHCVRWWWT